MALSDLAVKSAKPDKKPYQLKDEAGLFLDIRPTGKKVWRVRYWIAGKENKYTIGEYPLIGLKEARERRDEARKLISVGVKPKRKKGDLAVDNRAGLTFGDITEEFVAKRKKETKSIKPVDAMESRLRRYVLPFLGNMLPDEISPPLLLNVIRRIEAKGIIESAHRTLSVCGQIFRYAIATGRANRDPSADLRGALQTVQVKHHSAVIEPKEVGSLMRACENYSGTVVVRTALLLSALTFVRQGELRHMEWSEVDLEKAEWRIPYEKMKMKGSTKVKGFHIVPLSHQAVDLLRELKVATGHGRYAFPSERTPAGERPIGEGTVNVALRRMGYTKEEVTAHGFRATASTLLYESGKWPGDVIELQLAHQERNKVKAAYAHVQYLDIRREMMQWWANYLDELRNGLE